MSHAADDPTPLPMTPGLVPPERLVPARCSAARARSMIPAVRHAMRAEGAPKWVVAILGALAKWLPILVQVAIQLAPLFAEPTPLPAPGPGDDPDGGPGVLPGVREAVRAMRAGELEGGD